MNMFEIGSILILITFAFTLYRAIQGPDMFDRIVAINSSGTLAVLLISIYGFLMNRPDFLDLAIIYGFLNVVGTIAILKFFRYGNLGFEESNSKERKK